MNLGKEANFLLRSCWYSSVPSNAILTGPGSRAVAIYANYIYSSGGIEKDPVDDGSILAVLDTYDFTQELSKIEGRPPPSSTNVRAASGPGPPEIRPFTISSPIAPATQHVQPVKALSPLENQSTRIYKGNYEFSRGPGRQKRRDRKRDQENKPASGAVLSASALSRVEGHKSYLE